MNPLAMDATGVKTSVAGFVNICNNAVLNSTLSLSGHVSGAAYLLALKNSVSASTGVEINKWQMGGQFELNSRGAESLPAAFLSVPRRHLSQTPAKDFFSEHSDRGTYFEFAGTVVEAFLARGRLRPTFQLSNLLLSDQPAYFHTLFPLSRHVK